LTHTKEKVLETFMDDEELFVESVNMFLDNVKTRMTNLQKAVAERRVEEIKAEAHTIKGMMGYFTAGPPYEAAKKLELMGRENILDGVDAAFADLEDNLAKLSDVMKGWVG
jgi:HPt (histidine-containing phosphotransfer) domain-containing protein